MVRGTWKEQTGTAPVCISSMKRSCIYEKIVKNIKLRIITDIKLEQTMCLKISSSMAFLTGHGSSM